MVICLTFKRLTNPDEGLMSSRPVRDTAGKWKASPLNRYGEADAGLRGQALPEGQWGSRDRGLIIRAIQGKAALGQGHSCRKTEN